MADTNPAVHLVWMLFLVGWWLTWARPRLSVVNRIWTWLETIDVRPALTGFLVYLLVPAGSVFALVKFVKWAWTF